MKLEVYSYVCEPHLWAWYWCTRSIQNQNATNFYHEKFTKLFPLIQCNLNCKNHWPFLRSTCTYLREKYSVKAILFFIRIIFNSNGLYAPTKDLKVKDISSSTKFVITKIILISNRHIVHRGKRLKSQRRLVMVNSAVLWQKEATLENDISLKWAKCVCCVHRHSMQYYDILTSISFSRMSVSAPNLELEVEYAIKVQSKNITFSGFGWFVSCFLLSE